MFIAFNTNLYNHMISDFIQVQVCQKWCWSKHSAIWTSKGQRESQFWTSSKAEAKSFYLSPSNILHIFTSLFCLWSASLLLPLEWECKHYEGKDFLSALLTTIWPMLELCLAHNRYLIIICSKNEWISKRESNN